MIETMVCLAILAVLVSLAAPQLRGAVVRQRLAGVRHELVASMHTARSEAMRRGLTVSLERKTDCATRLGSNDDWSCGWREVAGDLPAAAGGADASEVLQSFDIPAGLQLQHQGGGALMQFASTGQPLLVASKFILGPNSSNATPEALRMTVTLCINRTGKVRTVEGKTTC